MLPTKIHAWFLQYNIDPMIGWEIVEIATDNLSEIHNEAELFDHCHTYIVSMIEAVDDDPNYDRLNYFQNHLVPLIHTLSPYFNQNQRTDIFVRSADSDTPLIASAIRVAMNLP